jgi:hypothetical protein
MNRDEEKYHLTTWFIKSMSKLVFDRTTLAVLEY